MVSTHRTMEAKKKKKKKKKHLQPLFPFNWPEYCDVTNLWKEKNLYNNSYIRINHKSAHIEGVHKVISALKFHSYVRVFGVIESI